MSPIHNCNKTTKTTLFLTFLSLLLIPRLAISSSSFPLSTIAISVLTNTTLACAFVSAGPRYLLNCTTLTSPAATRTYRTNHAGADFYYAIAAGNGFLCSLGPTNVLATMSMQWWDVTPREDGWNAPSKRVYRGAPVAALSGGDSHVCGVVGGRLQCWRWPEVKIPSELRFSAAAVGGDYVCGLVESSGEIRCFGNCSVAGVVGHEPRGRHVALAAGTRHACGVAFTGGIACWGEDAAAAQPPPSDAVVSAIAAGDGTTCVLWGNWTVGCWPAAAKPPPGIGDGQFVAIEARGGAICGVLMTNYSVVCWGDREVVGSNHLVFDRVLPGPCTPLSSCRCGVWSGTGPLCGGGGAAICYPCGFQPRPPESNPTGAAAPPLRPDKKSPNNLVIAMSSLGAGVGFVLVGVLIAMVARVRRNRQRRADSGRIHAVGQARIERRLGELISTGPSSTVEQFPLAALCDATGGFAAAHRVGSGSFGSVYRATLLDGREVAIKRADPSPSPSTTTSTRRQFDREAAFLSELALLSRVNHKNLVRLYGFCAEAGERVLVYEFMSNGTLHDHLHKKPSLAPPLASWQARLRLALDAARGVEYMHTYAVPPIIHRDIKSSNILLDASWTAKVADFGLSLLSKNGGDNAFDDDESRTAAGTVGYMDPEYYRLQHLTEKSDVYSFGVVLLELLSGCKVIQRYEGSGSPKNVVEFTVPHIEADHVHRVLDQRLPLPTPGEMEAVAYVGYLAADCVNLSGRSRPTMSEVVGALERAAGACGEPTLSRSCTDRSV